MSIKFEYDGHSVSIEDKYFTIDGETFPRECELEETQIEAIIQMLDRRDSE